MLMSEMLLKTWLLLSRRQLRYHCSLRVTNLQELWSKNSTAVLEVNFAEYFERFTKCDGYPYITPIFLS